MEYIHLIYIYLNANAPPLIDALTGRTGTYLSVEETEAACNGAVGNLQGKQPENPENNLLNATDL